jgi:hypothetical protein
MQMVRTYRARFVASKSKPNIVSRRPRNIARRIIGTFSLVILVAGFGFESFRQREFDIEIANTIEAVARRSNPCFSYQKLDETEKLIKRKGLDSGNTEFIPDTSLYPSEGFKTNLTNWHSQIVVSIGLYKSVCDELIAIEPQIAQYNENEESGEELYNQLTLSNPLLNKKILTQDFSGPFKAIDQNLVDEKGVAIIPPNIHLMPYLRQFLLVRFLFSGILLLCYFGPILSFLSDKKTFKFGLHLLNKIAPWRL